MLDDDIKILDNLVSNISYEHERDSWQRIKAALAESTNSSHNSASTPCPKCKGVGFYVDRAFERINCDKCS